MIGETYAIGGNSERTNLQIVNTLCGILDSLVPKTDGVSYREQIAFVKDRPGHDFRYAIDSGKIREQLGWSPVHSFEDGISDTVRWYLGNTWWVDDILSGKYRLARIGCGQNDGEQ